MNILRILFTGILLAGLIQSPASAQEQPNVVFIVMDNWGWGDLGVQGSTIPTPKIDQLASEGLRLTNYNVESQCMPSRSAIHSARLPTRSGTAKNDWSAAREGLAPWEYTMPELFRDAGYKTAMFGKWHVGASDGRYPTDQGYDEWFGIKRSTNDAKYTTSHGFNPETLRVFSEDPYILESTRDQKPKKAIPWNMESRAKIDEWITDRSVNYIKDRAKDGKPFFLMVTPTAMHGPLVPNPRFKDKTGWGTFPDMMVEMDYNIGRIIDAVDKSGLQDNTIFILSGENGAVPEFGAGSNGPWRGGLGTGYEGGFRSPAMIRWPGKIEAGRVSDEIVAALDWMPTLAKMAGEEKRVPTDRPIDGIDQADFILGKQENSNREHHLMFIGDTLYAVKWRNFKMHFITREGRSVPEVKWSVPQLYNIKADPGEVMELNKTEEIGEYIWAAAEMLKYVGDSKKSMAKWPNIVPGEQVLGYDENNQKIPGGK